MKIDCYLSEQCGSHHQLRKVIEQALSGLGFNADVSFHTFTYDDAVSRGIMGSPSVWINGRDVFPGGASPGVT